MMTNNDDEESSSSDSSSNKAAEDHDNSSQTSSSNISEATAGGGTIAISSAKSAADAAEQSISTTSTTTTTTSSNNSKSPSKTGFSLILLPTLLLKFTIVLIVKFATDVVVYPLLYLYRWGRMGKKRIVRGIRRMFGKGSGEEGEINGGVKVNGDSA